MARESELSHDEVKYQLEANAALRARIEELEKQVMLLRYGMMTSTQHVRFRMTEPLRELASPGACL